MSHTFEINIKNPCYVPQLFKSFKNIQQRSRKILDKETVDEIIFNSKNTRDRLILELQARCGLRVGEVLNLKVSDETYASGTQIGQRGRGGLYA